MSIVAVFGAGPTGATMNRASWKHDSRASLSCASHYAMIGAARSDERHPFDERAHQTHPAIRPTST
jgi:hypothetical protein